MVDKELHVHWGSLIAGLLWAASAGLLLYLLTWGAPEDPLEHLLLFLCAAAGTATVRASLVTHNEEMYKLQSVMRDARNEGLHAVGRHHNTC